MNSFMDSSDPDGDSDPLDILAYIASLSRASLVRRGRVVAHFYQGPFVFMIARALGCAFGLISSFDDLLLYGSAISFVVRWALLALAKFARLGIVSGVSGLLFSCLAILFAGSFGS